MILPRKHQAELMHFHRTSPHLGTLAYHGMGLGKTLSTLWLAREHIQKLVALGVEFPKFMVILPKSAIPTWKVECHKHCPDIYRHMVIYPYSQLHHAIKTVKMMDVRMIVFDESHYLKSPETNRIETLAAFLREVGSVSGKFEHGRILMLTGTPMPNGAHELYTTWALCIGKDLAHAADLLVDKVRFDKWKINFSQRKEKKWKAGWGKNKREQTGSSFEGVQNIEMLQSLLGPVIHYKRVTDCIDLPKKQEIHVNLGLEDDRLLKDADLEKPEAYMALVERLARAKTPHAIEWVQTYLNADKNEPLLVFAMNRYPLEMLIEKFPKDVRMITGSETGAERAQNLKDFQEGKYRVLAMTYKCGSESLNLQNCKVSLYCGYAWCDSTIKQAIARTWRSGQQQESLHYFLVSGYNDSKILDLVRAKEEATNLVEDMLQETSAIELEVSYLDSLI